MSQRNTQNLDTSPYEETSAEYLVKLVGKANPDLENETNQRLLEVKKLSSQAKAAREESYRKIKEAAQKEKISNEEIKKRQEAIDLSIKELYKRPPGIPVVNEDFGKLQVKHKDRLGFIYVGDSAKSNSRDSSVNAPKISMAIGGGLEFSFNPITNETNTIFPQNDKIEGVAAQFHILSLADIDVKGILNTTVEKLSNRSAITANADILDFSANEMVIIRSRGDAYNSKGSRVMSPGGVHIISGQNVGENLIKKPESMVLGDSLNSALIKLTEIIGEINSLLISMNTDLLSLKTSLMFHTHPVPPALTPVVSLPSPELIAGVAPTVPGKTVVNISNCYSQLINLEGLKTNYLTSLSANKFVSDYNKVN